MMPVAIATLERKIAEKYSQLLLNSPLIGNAKNILIIGKQMISLLLGTKLNVDQIIVSPKAAAL